MKHDFAKFGVAFGGDGSGVVHGQLERQTHHFPAAHLPGRFHHPLVCPLYNSDAADE